jgi:CheY-like chemotaxis protein
MTRTVLIIDDEPDIRTIGRIALSSVGGWTVLQAASGQEGLTLARSARPDLILLDVMMPELDGPATLERLHASDETRAIPVIFMTAKALRREVEQWVALGARGVITKPFDPMQLAAEVEALLGGGA